MLVHFGPDLVGVGALELGENAFGAVEGDQRFCVRSIYFQPSQHCLRLVIITLHERLASVVADAGHFRRIELHVIDAPAAWVDPTRRQTIHDNLNEDVFHIFSRTTQGSRWRKDRS